MALSVRVHWRWIGGRCWAPPQAPPLTGGIRCALRSAPPRCVCVAVFGAEDTSTEVGGKHIHRRAPLCPFGTSTRERVPSAYCRWSATPCDCGGPRCRGWKTYLRGTVLPAATPAWQRFSLCQGGGRSGHTLSGFQLCYFSDISSSFAPAVGVAPPPCAETGGPILPPPPSP